jgi:AbiV family abortive infection protein
MNRKPEVFRNASCAAIANARSLLADARLLYDNRRHARAQSLAIIGHEEVGKALVYALAATPLLVELRDLLTGCATWADPSKQHFTKHYVMLEAEEVLTIVQEEQLGNRLAAGLVGRNRLAEVTELLEGLAMSLRPYLINPDKAKKLFRSFEHNSQAKYPSQIPADFTPEQRKWNGLYVDLQRGVVCQPTDVGRRDALIEFRELKKALTGLSDLTLALQDSAGWLRLCADLA